jgi:DNA-binding transcriptional regulator LsrR (DeoR family)
MPRGKKKEGCDIDLGLAISALTLRYGQTRTHQQIADFCGCSRAAIQSIENKAMRKIRVRCHTDEELRELLEDYRSHSHSPLLLP